MQTTSKRLKIQLIAGWLSGRAHDQITQKWSEKIVVAEWSSGGREEKLYTNFVKTTNFLFS